ncbi:MAG: iron-sulfur cluster-binding domain-containing protein, partial [Pseudomonas sp.]|nr:iron-sulfur cluster-binding domain-containing protein [Pseudomonas sp.]
RSSDRAAFVERIRHSAFADRVFVHFDEQPETLMNASQVLANPQPDVHLYVCGPAGFMQHVLDSARTQGWAEDRLHREYFAAAAIDSSHDGSFSVKVASSGQIIEIPADKTVVAVLESHGIDIPMSCEQGVCGTCETRILEGQAEHNDQYLSDDEKAAQQTMMICVSRARGERLVLDL